MRPTRTSVPNLLPAMSPTFLSKKLSYYWYVQQYDCGYVKTYYGPYNPSYKCPKFLQCVYKTAKNHFILKLLYLNVPNC